MAVVGTEAGDVMAGTADGQFGWRTGLGAVIAGVGAGAGMWRGWADAAGGAERWIEGAGACAAAGEGGLHESGVGNPAEVAVGSCGGYGGSEVCWNGDVSAG